MDSTGFFGVRVLRTSKFAGRSQRSGIAPGPPPAEALLQLPQLHPLANHPASLYRVQHAPSISKYFQDFPSIQHRTAVQKLYEMDRNGTKFIDEDLGHGKYNARPSLLAGKRKALAA